MQDGLYKVQFQVDPQFRAPGDSGTGVVMLSGGVVRGGDSIMYYTGTYAVNGESLTADVTAAMHSQVPGMGSVFGLDLVHLALKGHVTGNTIVLGGTAREAPDIPFAAELERLAD
jgi:hypothetical protein